VSDHEEENIEGAAAEVLADYENRKTVTRFLHPETGEMVMELHLDPEVAREYAFNLTRCSISVEEHSLPNP
jgi:hypothetical protein